MAVTAEEANQAFEAAKNIASEAASVAMNSGTGEAAASLGDAASSAASTVAAEGAKIETLEFLTGPALTEWLLKTVKPVADFRIEHPVAGRFDSWFEATFGAQHTMSSDFPLMTPHAVALIALSYLAFVFIGVAMVRAVGGGIKIKPIMRVYNAFMVVLSFYMGSKAILLARASNSTVFCVPLAKGIAGNEMARLTWLFTFSKVVEFLDTVFMIVEGRLRQVSFLHVFHPVSILTYWFCITWMVPGSDAYFSLAGNSFIHVAMYSYYLMASFGYSPWWKYYMTKAQILQFCLFCVQSVYVGFVLTETKCDFPNVLSRALLWYMLILIALFMHFLLTSKGKKKKTADKKTQ